MTAADPDVILLGHRGFVGSAIAGHLTSMGVPYVGVDRTNVASRGAAARILINANGSSDKRLARRDPVASFRANVDAAMASLHDFRFERYVLISSVDVYPDLGEPLRTSEDVEITPERLSPYGLHKLLTEIVVRCDAPSWTILRLGPLVGPGLRKNAIHDLIVERRTYVHPDSCYSYIDTRDVARVVTHVWDRRGEIVNVAGIGCVRVGDVAERLGVGIDPSGLPPAERYEVSVDKLRATFDIPTSAATIERFIAERTRSAAGSA